ncbi:MAG: hypothetical protein KatS3mg068_2244 [Candidatus Sericytochromatia bacterium]|nr:MAG: hypothetical protein KatS3mg068_2244 [Candidatus Sericytochromatia bacterium]
MKVSKFFISNAIIYLSLFFVLDMEIPKLNSFSFIKSRLEKLFDKDNKINNNYNIALQSPDTLFKNFRLNKNISSFNFLNNGDNNKLINENSRVLHIGDSHTVGYYGKEMDKLFRQTGAKVMTLGSSGSTPSSWLNGYVTKSGFRLIDETGKDRVPSELRIIDKDTERKLKNGQLKEWQIPTKTPNLNDLISSFRPNVIVFSLGANLIHADPNTIEKQVKEVCEIAKTSGAKIVWVGPPDGRPDKKPEHVQNKLYEHIKKVVQEYGYFIDSRPYTDYPSSLGGDGVHFHGKKGEEISKKWSKNVFNEIQSK